MENLNNTQNLFDILSIKKEMEIENIFLTDQNIIELQNLYNGNITANELVSKAFTEISDLN